MDCHFVPRWSCCNRIVLLQDWRNHCRNLKSWSYIQCSPCQVFLLNIVCTVLDVLWAIRRVILEKKRRLTRPVNLVYAPSFLLSPSSRLFYFIFFYFFKIFFVRVIFIIKRSLLSLSVFPAWFLSMYPNLG